MKTAIIAFLLVALAGCSLPVLFRVPVSQGNVLSENEVRQLEVGMTPPQVQYLLGTPLVNSAFETQRWDYVFFLRNERGRERESRLSLFFREGKLARIEGDDNYDAQLPESRERFDPDAIESPETRPLFPTSDS